MKVGVVGLGLIGGSIFKALRDNTEGKYQVVGVSSSVKEENVSNDYNTLKDCDLVFVCSPMSATLEVLDRLEDILSSNAIVTDVCSLKGFVSKKNYGYKFIPSHPMAGTENNGWESSFSELFKGAKWAITPLNNELLEEQDVLESIIEDLGAIPIITTPEEHDRAVALISHMPMLIAQAMCKSIKGNKLAQILAASGFRDTTRLALSNTQMANDMIEMNSLNIKEAIKLLNLSVDELLTENYRSNIEEIKEFRRNLY